MIRALVGSWVNYCDIDDTPSFRSRGGVIRMDLGSEGCFIDIRLNDDRAWLGMSDEGCYHLVQKVMSSYLDRTIQTKAKEVEELHDRFQRGRR